MLDGKVCLIFSRRAGNSWKTKMSMHDARSSLGVASLNGKIYAIGGVTANGVTDANEEYDPSTDTWILRMPMPIPSSGFGIAVYQDKIYCIGETANQVYDPATDSWETKTPMPTPRSSLKATVVDGKIYLMGGYVPDDSDFGYSISALNEVYDVSSDSWATKAPMLMGASS